MNDNKNMIEIKKRIVKWLTNYSKKSNTNGYIIGISGGIDSAVTSTLCAETGKPLLVLEMPIHQNSEEVNRAKKHIEWLKSKYPNVTSREVDLTSTYETFKQSGVQAVDDNEAYEFSLSNTRARLRMTCLYQFAGQLNYLVAGTGNKVEDFGIGFFSKYGDGGVDLSPIGDLLKSEVYQLAKTLGVINEILIAVPTDGLHEDSRTDEEQIGATYSELEWAMKYNSHNNDSKDELTDRQIEVLGIYDSFHKKNKHKMLPIPVCKLGKFFK